MILLIFLKILFIYQCVAIYSYLGLSIPEKMKPIIRTHVTCAHGFIDFDKNVSHLMLSWSLGLGSGSWLAVYQK